MKKIDPFSEGGKLKKRYLANDIGTSNLFADMYGDELIYVSDLAEWYSFDGKRWQPDYQLKRYKLIKDMAEHMNQLCFKRFETGDELTKHLQYYFNLTKKAFRDKIIKDAESVNCLTSELFDKHKFLFNCTNGTYDFKAKKFRKHDAKDFLTDMSNVEYNPKAKAPKFQSYMSDIMYSDKIKMEYLLKWGGLTLTGDTSKECFLFLYGEGTRNGKSTFVSTLSYILGTYSKVVRAESFQKKEGNSGGGQAASGDIARLKGARLVVVNEMNKDLKLDIALVKNLSGGDTITARELYKSEKEYTPQFKIIFNTNFLPQMTDDTIFKSDRLHLLEFKRHFKLEERKIDLKDQLKEESSGIFNTLLEHYYMLESDGFEIPEDSKTTIASYELRSNNIKQFINEYLTVTGDEKNDYIQLKDVYMMYETWLEETDSRKGRVRRGRQSFVEEMRRVGGIETVNCSRKIKGVFYKTRWMLGLVQKDENPVEKQANIMDELIPLDDDEALPF